MGDVNKNAFFKGLNPAFGAVFRYNPNFRWALKTNLMWGQVSGTTEGQQNVFPDHAQGSFSRSLIELGGQMEFNFFPYSDKFAYSNAMSVAQAYDFISGLELTPTEEMIAGQIIKEIRERLGFLINVGLEYLTLARSSGTLSGGESQRIRLATQIGSSPGGSALHPG